MQAPNEIIMHFREDIAAPRGEQLEDVLRIGDYVLIESTRPLTEEETAELGTYPDTVESIVLYERVDDRNLLHYWYVYELAPRVNGKRSYRILADACETHTEALCYIISPTLADELYTIVSTCG